MRMDDRRTTDDVKIDVSGMHCSLHRKVSSQLFDGDKIPDELTRPLPLRGTSPQSETKSICRQSLIYIHMYVYTPCT
jgi:hypothetical protein